ncbi:MAG: formylglycine-generating enzyme family protein [Planctomycetia bacterium]|nr:formylglycine-generating enzyme family protein [Planctomycetia bacterium]
MKNHTTKITWRFFFLFITSIMLGSHTTHAITQNEEKTISPITAGKEPGERMIKIINGVEYAFRWCPPGEFIMGSSKTEEGRHDNEKSHRVTITKGFWILETEVTQEMWQNIITRNPSFHIGSHLPVESVTWENCQHFLLILRQYDLNAQLPTEAQWEYACRAGTTTPFSFGNTLNGDKANCDGNFPYGTSTKGDYLKKTTSVKSYFPNAWGIFDMHGNVREWCADWYNKNYYFLSSSTDPTGPSSGTARVVRGGSWSIDAKHCRSADRNYISPELCYYNLGFRFILSLEPISTQIPFQNVSTSEKREPGERMVKTINGVEYAFRWCPPGSFMMGSPHKEKGRFDDEIWHMVTLTKGFWILETEVTQEMWENIMKKPQSKQGKFSVSGIGPKHPVYNVSWNDCQEFCYKLHSLGLKVQLPTEAQWEYACRAGTTTSLNSGKNITSIGSPCAHLDEVGWYKNNSEYIVLPVAQKKPNAWGLYDMHGNAREWCQDIYKSYPTQHIYDPINDSSETTLLVRPHPLSRPHPQLSPERVIRGGSCGNFVHFCRSATRSKRTPDTQDWSYGFRVILFTSP